MAFSLKLRPSVAGDCWPDDAEHVCQDNAYAAGAYGQGTVTALTLSTVGGLTAWITGHPSDAEYVLGYSPDTDATEPWAGRAVQVELPGGGLAFNTLQAGATALVGASDIATFYWRFGAMGEVTAPQLVAPLANSRAIAIDLDGDGETDLVQWDDFSANGFVYDDMVAGLRLPSLVQDCTTRCPSQVLAVREPPGTAQHVIIFSADQTLTRYRLNDVNTFEEVAGGGATIGTTFLDGCTSAALSGAAEDDVLCWNSGSLFLASVDSTMSTSYVQAVAEHSVGFIRDVAVVDFNQDGTDELLVAEGDAIVLRVPDGAPGDFIAITLWEGSAERLLTHDVDGDDDLDLLIVEPDRTLTWIQNRGGRFAPAGSPTGTLP